ncbi:MAG: integrase core domain-containing protein, partial [Myxococcales bacterium]|nr:integrase core domain-containing protein [Myxococcales bacterium]
VAKHENSALAKQLFREAIERCGVPPGTLTVHQDRGAPMTSHGFAELLTELGVDRSFSRPRVSNDNPMSESLFHTTESQPDYPGRFRDIEHARTWCADFFTWYNAEHHHDRPALFTPQQVYMGHVEAVAARRQQALDEAYQRHPERFVAGSPIVRRPPERVLINPLDAAPPTMEAVLDTPDDQLAELWPALPNTDIPIIHLPGAASSIGEQAVTT